MPIGGAEMFKMFLIVLALVFILGIFICLILNFKSLIDFQWNIDYIVSKDAVCEKQRWTAFEVESARYNLSNFRYGDRYSSIKKQFTDTYAIVTTIFGLLFVFSIFGLIIRFAVHFLGFNSSSLDNIPFLWILIPMFIFLLIYITVTSKYLDNFKEIEEDPSLTSYYKVYKILNAIIVTGNVKDIELKYAFEGLDKDTLDHILEKNIASYEDISMSSRVKDIKAQAYKNLDFLKYLVFDKYSAYYLPYFDHVYISKKMAENVFLDDLYANYEKAVKDGNTFEKIKTEDIKKAVSIVNDDKQSYDKKTQLTDILKILNKPKSTNLNEIHSDYEYLKTLIKDFPNEGIYKTLKELLDGLKAYMSYLEYNNNIHNVITNAKNPNAIVPDGDYIEFYLNNKDVLTTPNKMEDIIIKTKAQATYVYTYYIYFSLMFLAFSHYMFRTTDRLTYIYILAAVLLMYILFIWIYTQLSFLA
jgi:hypothetical protein